MEIELRAYQKEAVDKIFQYFKTGKKRPLATLSVAAGKSVIIAAIIKRCIEISDDARVLVITHRAELIKQNSEKLDAFGLSHKSGFFSAGLKKKDRDAQVLFAAIQTLSRSIKKLNTWQMVIIDECHLVDFSTKQYGAVLEDITQRTPKTPVIGLTGTPWRGRTHLLRVENPFFDGEACNVGIGELIKKRFLTTPVSKSAKTKFDLSGLKVRAGDFIEGDLQKAFSDEPLLRMALNEVVALSKNRKAVLIFCAGVENAYACAAYLEGAAVITGKTNKKTRDETINHFRNGQIKYLISVGTLTTGFDAPIADVVVLLRATLSAVLFVQMVGRGLRLYPGKNDVLILDYGENLQRFGPIDSISLDEKSYAGQGESPFKICPECDQPNRLAERFCVHCGADFPEQERDPKITIEAASDAVLEAQIEPKTDIVIETTYRLHSKNYKPKSIRVDCKISIFKTISFWLFPEHDGYARANTEKQLRKAGVINFASDLPRNSAKVIDMLELGNAEVDEISYIEVPRQKYPKIKGYTWK